MKNATPRDLGHPRAEPVDRFLFTSPLRAEPGYVFAARTPGLTEAELDEMSLTFTLVGSPVDVGADRWPTAWLAFPLRCSGRVVVGRIDDADEDARGRPGRFAITGLVMTPEVHQRLFDGLLARIDEPLDPDRTDWLAPFTISGARREAARDQLQGRERAIERLLALCPESITSLLAATERGERVAVVSSHAVTEDLQAVLRLLPVAERSSLSVITTTYAWGTLCERFRWVASPRAVARRESTRGLTVLDWDAPGATPPGASAYVAGVEGLLRERDAAGLRRLFRDLETLDRLPSSPEEIRAYFALLRAQSQVELALRPAPAEAAAAAAGLVDRADPALLKTLHAKLVLAAAQEDDPVEAVALLRICRGGEGTVRPIALPGLREAFPGLVEAQSWIAALVVAPDVGPMAQEDLVAAVTRWARDGRRRADELASIVQRLARARLGATWDDAGRRLLARLLGAALDGADRRGVSRQLAGLVADLAAGVGLDAGQDERAVLVSGLVGAGRSADAARLLLARPEALPDAAAHAVRLLDADLDDETLGRLTRLVVGDLRGEAAAERLAAWEQTGKPKPERLAPVLVALGDAEAVGVLLARRSPRAARALAGLLADVAPGLLVRAVAAVGPGLAAGGDPEALLAALPARGLSVGWRQRLALLPIDGRLAVAPFGAALGRFQAERALRDDHRQTVQRVRGAIDEKRVEARAELERRLDEVKTKLDCEEQLLVREAQVAFTEGRQTLAAEAAATRARLAVTRAAWSTAVTWRGGRRARAALVLLILLGLLAIFVGRPDRQAREGRQPSGVLPPLDVRLLRGAVVDSPDTTPRRAARVTAGDGTAPRAPGTPEAPKAAPVGGAPDGRGSARAPALAPTDRARLPGCVVPPVEVSPAREPGRPAAYPVTPGLAETNVRLHRRDDVDTPVLEPGPSAERAQPASGPTGAHDSGTPPSAPAPTRGDGSRDEPSAPRVPHDSEPLYDHASPDDVDAHPWRLRSW